MTTTPLTEAISKGIAGLRGTITDPEELAEVKAAEDNYYEFLRQAWNIADKTSIFEENNAIKSVCLHLQAITEGTLRKLIVNEPPGFGKSLSLVCWPAWEWTKNPRQTWLFLTYSDDFAQRDSNRCRDLIKSDWYQERWGHIVKIRDDRDTGRKFELEAGGTRHATSTQGGGTGARATRIVCFPYHTTVATDRGDLPIGKIVDGRLRVKVASVSHKNGQLEFQPIVKWHKSPGQDLIEIGFSIGRNVACTAEHPVFVIGRGYIPASDLALGDKVIHASCYVLPKDMRKRVLLSNLQQSQEKTEVLLLSMLAARSHRTGNIAVRALRKTVLPCAWTQEALQKTVLQSNMPACRVRWQRQSRMGRKSKNTMRDLREGRAVCTSYDQENLRQQGVLARSVQQNTSSGHFHELSRMQQGNQDHQMQDREAQVLLRGMCQLGPLEMDSGGKESTLSARSSLRRIPAWMDDVFQEQDQATRSRPMPYVRCGQNDTGTEPQLGYPSHQRRQKGHRAAEPLGIMSVLPLSDYAHQGRQSERENGSYSLCVAEVRTTRRVQQRPDFVYNLEVGTNKNYFAEGVLVHNCDDVNKIEHAYSEVEKERVNGIFDSLVSGRGANPKTTTFVIVQQRLAINDITGHVLGADRDDEPTPGRKRKKKELERRLMGYTHFFLPLEFDPKNKCKTPIWEDWRTEPGESLWPERYDQETIADWRNRLGPLGSAAQLQQNPTDIREHSLFPSTFKHFRVEHEENEGNVLVLMGEIIKRFPERLCYWFQVIDTALKEGRENDLTACGTFLATPEYDLLVYDMDAERVPVPKQYEWILSKRQKHPKVMWQAIEGRASGVGLIQEGKIKGTPFREIGPDLYQMGDIARAQEASTRYANGMVWHRKNRGWTVPLESELQAFPFGVRNDRATTVIYAALLMKREQIFRIGLQGMTGYGEQRMETAHDRVAQAWALGESNARDLGLFGLRPPGAFEEPRRESRGRRMFGR